MQICRVRIAECPLPLPHVLRLGPVEISTRDYLVVRVETDSGIFGEAIGYPRGTPLFETVGRLARRVLGADPSMPRQLMLALEQSNVPGRASLTRALSLLDIALWDITSKRAQLPLFRMLGALRTSVEVTVVAGYFMDRRTIPDIVSEVTSAIESGYQRVKIMLKGDDPGFDREYAAAVSRAASGRVGADAHWTWSTLTEAKRLCRDLDELGLNFLEDPFAASDIDLTHQLGRLLKTPLAAGEDLFGARNISELVRGIDILRVDATTCGGVTGAIEAINIAAGAGRTVLPHVFGPLHVHLACAFPNVEAVEVIPEESGADPVHTLLLQCPPLKDGRMSPSEEPGAGICLNWDSIEKSARRVEVITPGS